MSKTTRKESTAHSAERDELALFRKMTRLLDILVRLNLRSLKGDRSQNDMISLLDSVGCGQSEIADFLGTTTNTVNASLYKLKKKAARK